MIDKREGIVFIVVSLISAVLFAFFFVNCIMCYFEFDVEYEELKYAELTFSRFEKLNRYRGGSIYEIYFKEYAKPFEVSNITQGRLDKKALETVKEDDKIKIYYIENSSKNYEYEICEMKTDSSVLLSLEDYREVNQNNQTIGMILCPIMIGLSLFLVWIFAHVLRPEIKDGLGKIRIEYQSGENIVRVYNSPSRCSLVINDRCVDQFLGYFGDRFSLIGRLNVNGKNIRVEARMGYFNMRLYYDGQLVAKKFMGLG